MKEDVFTRRGFLVGVAAAFGGSVSAYSRSRAEATGSIRLGGPVFVKSRDPEVLAQAHLDLGYRAAYAPDLKLSETDRIRATAKAYAARDVVIAEVGAWVNMLDPDSEKRKTNLAFVTDKLALAEELGALCCVDIAGSYNPEDWAGPHPDNLSQRFFDATVENVRTVIDAVKPSRTVFSIEMMGWAIPSSPDEYLRLIEAVDRKAFGAHIDICNMINSPARIYSNRAIIAECFAKLGPWVVSCHAKDVAWVQGSQIHFQEVVPGRGEVDYTAYLRELARLPGEAPLMLEHLRTPEQYAEGREHIQKVARQLNLSWE
jgi:sugar phosphate isomerase/epimerase